MRHSLTSTILPNHDPSPLQQHISPSAISPVLSIPEIDPIGDWQNWSVEKDFLDRELEVGAVVIW